jgi:hypothetical protein
MASRTKAAHAWAESLPEWERYAIDILSKMSDQDKDLARRTPIADVEEYVRVVLGVKPMSSKKKPKSSKKTTEEV